MRKMTVVYEHPDQTLKDDWNAWDVFHEDCYPQFFQDMNVKIKCVYPASDERKHWKCRACGD